MIPPLDCAACEDDPCDDKYCGDEPDWEDLAYDFAKEREFEEAVSCIHESKRQLRDYDKYTNKQLRDISKESKYLTRFLWQEYQFDVAGDFFEVSYDSKYYFTVPRRGAAHAPDTLTRKDKRRRKKDLRKRGRQAESWLRKRQLGISTERGCNPRPVMGYEGESFTRVVAAT